MNCLVTGGAGFIGSHLTSMLLGQGHRVIVLDDLSTGRLENLAALKSSTQFSFFKGSILDPVILDHILSQGIEEVYHLAAVVGVDLVLEKPARTIEVNAIGTEIVFDACERYRCRVVYTSSSEVYGNHNCEYFEESAIRQYGPTDKLRWSYAIAKSISEQSGLGRFYERAFPITIARLFNTIGPRQRSTFGMVVPTFIEQAKKGKAITIYGDGQQRRCFSWVTDICRGLIELMRTQSTIGEIYNIGTNEEVTISELAHLIKDLTLSTSEIIHVSYQNAYNNNFDEVFYRRPSLEKIARAIGYQPTIKLNDMLDTIIWGRQ